jgi:hypothetical protein
MRRRLLKLAYALAFAIVRTRAAVADAWRTALAGEADKYRPEAHYMRGPGPKWRAKHAEAPSRRHDDSRISTQV